MPSPMTVALCLWVPVYHPSSAQRWAMAGHVSAVCLAAGLRRPHGALRVWWRQSGMAFSSHGAPGKPRPHCFEERSWPANFFMFSGQVYGYHWKMEADARKFRYPRHHWRAQCSFPPGRSVNMFDYYSAMTDAPLSCTLQCSLVFKFQWNVSRVIPVSAIYLKTQQTQIYISVIGFACSRWPFSGKFLVIRCGFVKFF